MQMSQPKLATSIALALIFALGVSACGKNMNLNLKTPAKGEPADVGDEADGRKGLGGPASGRVENNTAAANNANVGTPEQPASTNNSTNNSSNQNQAVVYPDLDGKLQPFSVFDLSDPSLRGNRYPYLNIEKDAKGGEQPARLVHIGDEAGYVVRNNLIFRAIHFIPRKELVESIENFKLVLRGVRLYNEKGATRNTLSKQVLCIVDTKACSGEKQEEPADNLNPTFWSTDTIKSPDFAKASVPVTYKKIQDAVLMSTEAEGAKDGEIQSITIDLISAFGLTGKSAAEVIAWIEKNTTPFTVDKPGLRYRKFRFVIANNVYVKEGELLFQYNQKKGAELADADQRNNPAGVDDYIHGPTDAIDGSKQVAVPGEMEKAEENNEASPTETKTEDQTNTNQNQTTENDTVPGPIVNVVDNSKLNEDQSKRVDLALELYENTVLKFAPNRADISDADLLKLGETAAILKSQGSKIARIAIIGRTSVTHPKKTAEAGKKYNHGLGKVRAKVVKQALVSRQISESLITTDSFVPDVSSCRDANGKIIRECDLDRRVTLEITLSDELKGHAGVDSIDVIKTKEEEFKRIVNALAEELRSVWEADVRLKTIEVQP